MADGSRKHSFHLPPPTLSRLRPGEIVVDLFAGGGGASPPPLAALARANLDSVHELAVAA